MTLFSFSLINTFVWFKYEAKIIHVFLCPFSVLGFFLFFFFLLFFDLFFFFTLKIMYIVSDSADLHYMSIRTSALPLALLCQESHSVVWVPSIKKKIRRENKGFKMTLKPKKNIFENKTKPKNEGLNVW